EKIYSLFYDERLMIYPKWDLILTTFILLSFSAISWAQPKGKTPTDSLAFFNRFLSPPEMQEDLQVFIDIRENLNSGLYIYKTKEQIDSIYQWAFEKVKQRMPITDFFKIILHLSDFEGSVHNYTE